MIRGVRLGARKLWNKDSNQVVWLLRPALNVLLLFVLYS